jgi:hypothetical protein
LTAACSGQDLNPPASPTSVLTPAQTPAQGGAQLPFSGSFTRESTASANCPPTCPPTTLRIVANAKGTATHLGGFTATSEDLVDTATNTGTGTLRFVASNGDELFARTIGREDRFVPPNVSFVTFVATITGGTGRFEGASGTFTIHQVETIDFASSSATGSGEFSGHINFNR